MSPNDDSPMDSNSVTYRPDYIEVIWRGAQNAEKVRVTNIEFLTAAKRFQAEHKPVLAFLKILNHPAMPNMAAFAEVITIFQAVPFDRLAVSGDLPATVMPLITTVIETFNRQLEIKYLKNPDEALVWLRSNEPGSRVL
jgi:hypothetical protein